MVGRAGLLDHCDLVGWVVGPWWTKGYTVRHDRRAVRMKVSRAELLDLGVDVDVNA